MTAPDAALRADADGDLNRIAAIRADDKAGRPVDLDTTENVAQWCVFLGDQLGAPKMIVTAAAAIRAQANEIKKLRDATAGLEACAAGAATPVLHIRGDQLTLALAVIAAARAWAHGGGEEALRLADAVSAYEAALPPGAA